MYHTWKYRRRWVVACAAVLLAAVTGIAGFCLRQTAVSSGSGAVSENGKPVIILDAGHGGVDPGAIGVNQAEEKEINLAIALALRDILRVNGYEVVMIREEDVSVADPGITRISALKSSDLKNRLQTIHSYPGAIALSIHQNFFTESQYSGAQMFYGRQNPESETLAEVLQAAFRELLQPGNERMVKRSTSDVYIVHNAENPIVLVECGFLSNPAECEALCDTAYQQKVAFTIFRGLCDYAAAGGDTEAEEKE